MTVEICFLPDNVSIQAQVGEPLLNVAERAGITIPHRLLNGILPCL